MVWSKGLLICGNHRGGEFKSNFMTRIEKNAKMCTWKYYGEVQNKASFYIQVLEFHLRRLLLCSIYSQYPLQDNDPIFFFIEILWMHERIESTNADIDYNVFLMDMVCSLFLSKINKSHYDEPSDLIYFMTRLMTLQKRLLFWKYSLAKLVFLLSPYTHHPFTN